MLARGWRAPVSLRSLRGPCELGEPGSRGRLRVCLRPPLEARCGQRQILLAAGLVWISGFGAAEGCCDGARHGQPDRKLGGRVVAGVAGRSVRGGAYLSLRRRGPGDTVCMRGERSRPRRVRRSQGCSANGPVHAPCVGGGASGRVGLRARDRAARGECRHRDRDGAWRRRVVRGVRDPADSPRAGPRESFLDRSNASEPCRRVGLDRARHARAAADGVDSLRSVEHGARGRPGCDSARPRRCHVLRRDGGARNCGGGREFRRDASALTTQRRPSDCVPSIRRRARRLRDGRGSRGPSARGTRACACTRRTHLRRTDRLRRLLRRESRLRSRPGRFNPARALRMALTDQASTSPRSAT